MQAKIAEPADMWLVWWVLAGAPTIIPEYRFWDVPSEAFMHQPSVSWFSRACADGTVYRGPQFILQSAACPARIFRDIETGDWHTAVPQCGTRGLRRPVKWWRSLAAAKRHVRMKLLGSEPPPAATIS